MQSKRDKLKGWINIISIPLGFALLAVATYAFLWRIAEIL